MEKQPSFDRIIGRTKEQKEKFKKDTEETSQESGEQIFGEYLVEPTDAEKIAIREAVEYANKIAAYYGSTRAINAERVFLLKDGGVESTTKGRTREGVFNAIEQSIGVDRRYSNALLAASVVHELFHLTSYQAAQILEDGNHKPYRSGIEMTGRQKEGNYFSHAQEAIIAILSRKFFDEVISKNLLYVTEIEQTEAIKKWLADFSEERIKDQNVKQKALNLIRDILIFPDSKNVYDKLCRSNESDAYKFGYFQSYFEKEFESETILQERQKEREKFDNVLDEIIRSSNGKITDKNELFDEFARAHFTGNYLPLARILEDALGKGAFRKIAIELGEIT